MKRQGDRKKNIGAYQAGWRMSTRILNPAAMGRLGARLARLPLPPVWLLRGPLGAGKTTLVRGVLRSLGIRHPVSSPTFTLVKHYRTRGRWGRVVHVDAYRLTLPSQVPSLGLPEALLDPRTLVLVEWPERIRSIRWPARVVVRLTHQWPGRHVVITTAGVRGSVHRPRRLRQPSLSRSQK